MVGSDGEPGVEGMSIHFEGGKGKKTNCTLNYPLMSRTTQSIDSSWVSWIV